MPAYQRNGSIKDKLSAGTSVIRVSELTHGICLRDKFVQAVVICRYALHLEPMPALKLKVKDESGCIDCLALGQVAEDLDSLCAVGDTLLILKFEVEECPEHQGDPYQIIFDDTEQTGSLVWLFKASQEVQRPTTSKALPLSPVKVLNSNQEVQRATTSKASSPNPVKLFKPSQEVQRPTTSKALPRSPVKVLNSNQEVQRATTSKALSPNPVKLFKPSQEVQRPTTSKALPRSPVKVLNSNQEVQRPTTSKALSPNPVKKAGGTLDYAYTPLAAVQINTVVNVYGVVTFTKAPFKTKGSDIMSLISLTDPTLTYPEEKLSCNIFGKDEMALPSVEVGNVVRFHRLKIQTYSGRKQGYNGPGFHWLVFAGSVDRLKASSESYTFKKEDRAQVQNLLDWWDEKERHSVSASTTHTLSEVRPKQYFNLVCQVVRICNLYVDTGLCKLLRIWDGTRFEGLIKMAAENDFNESVNEDGTLMKASAQLAHDVYLFDNHALDSGHIKAGDYLLLTNLHAAIVNGRVELTLHGGISYGRKVEVLALDSPEVVRLKIVLSPRVAPHVPCTSTQSPTEHYDPCTIDPPSVSHEPHRSEQAPSVAHVPHHSDQIPSVSHVPHHSDQIPSISHVPHHSDQAPSVSHVPHHSDQAPSVSHVPHHSDQAPSVSHVPHHSDQAPSVSHVPHHSDQIPSVSHVPHHSDQIPSVSHVPHHSDQIPSVSHVPHHSDQIPSVSHVPHHSDQAPSVSHVPHHSDQVPSISHVWPQSSQPPSVSPVPRQNDQPPSVSHTPCTNTDPPSTSHAQDLPVPPPAKVCKGKRNLLSQDYFYNKQNDESTGKSSAAWGRALPEKQILRNLSPEVSGTLDRNTNCTSLQKAYFRLRKEPQQGHASVASSSGNKHDQTVEHQPSINVVKPSPSTTELVDRNVDEDSSSQQAIDSDSQQSDIICCLQDEKISSSGTCDEESTLGTCNKELSNSWDAAFSLNPSSQDTFFTAQGQMSDTTGVSCGEEDEQSTQVDSDLSCQVSLQYEESPDNSVDMSQDGAENRLEQDTQPPHLFTSQDMQEIDSTVLCLDTECVIPETEMDSSVTAGNMDSSNPQQHFINSCQEEETALEVTSHSEVLGSQPRDISITSRRISDIINNRNVHITKLSTVIGHKVPYKFRVQVQVTDYYPRPSCALDLLHWYCSNCQHFQSASEESQDTSQTVFCQLCPNCTNPQLCLNPTVIMAFKLSDGGASITANLWADNANTFFSGLNPLQLLNNDAKFCEVQECLMKLCPPDYKLGEKPWLDCCIFSYRAGETVKYQIFDTILV